MTAHIARLFALMWLLMEEPRRHQRRALAARFGVSERQLTKDLSVLAAGLRCRIRASPTGYHLDPVLCLTVPYRPRDDPRGEQPAPLRFAV